MFDFPEAATAHLCERWEVLREQIDVAARFPEVRRVFLEGEKRAFEPLLQEIATESEIHRYTVDLLFLLWCLPTLRADYAARGIADEIFVATMKDLRYKLLECYANHGVWGNFVSFWYPGFYRCERFALGRLQFERVPFKYPVYGEVQEGDTVLNCHIPSSGPLTPEAVLHSLKCAYAFYPDLRRNGVLTVVCHSWLLYPPHRALFGENTVAFYDLFDVIDQKASESNADFWRIFAMPFAAETLPNAPEDTSLRRRFKAFLTAGNTMGSGYGVLRFDGETVLARP